ncbi:MAG: hypothetical protein LBR39_07075 [Coriobacteriales bacterium]|nr:hypothetical protein [Coriobacteriales bacterium]
MLSERRQKVLNALVDEYVITASPVGSRTLAQRYLTGVSAATIRNELSRLETEGYAASPHTSAGRVPTNGGYRLFVNAILLQNIGLTSAMTAAVEPLPRRLGMVGAEDLHPLDGFDTEESLKALSDSTGQMAVLWIRYPERIIRRQGLSQLLSQPEFRDAATVIPLLRLLETPAALTLLLEDCLRTNNFVVQIGIEDDNNRLSAFSLVAERIHREPLDGVIALFGPTRMDYRRAIDAIGMAAEIISQRGVQEARRDLFGN